MLQVLADLKKNKLYKIIPLVQHSITYQQSPEFVVWKVVNVEQFRLELRDVIIGSNNKPIGEGFKTFYLCQSDFNHYRIEEYCGIDLCECGAKYGGNPTWHSTWCPANVPD